MQVAESMHDVGCESHTSSSGKPGHGRGGGRLHAVQVPHFVGPYRLELGGQRLAYRCSCGKGPKEPNVEAFIVRIGVWVPFYGIWVVLYPI